MTIINISSLILIAIGYFREHYTIVDLETWNEICRFYNENHNEDNEKNYELNEFCEWWFWNFAAKAANAYEFVSIRNEVAKFYLRQFVSFV